MMGLLDHPLRTGLTGLGIVFGVAAVISMLSIGEGAQREAQQLISCSECTRSWWSRQASRDTEEAVEARKASLGLRVHDGEVLLGAVPQLMAVGGRRSPRSKTCFRGSKTPPGLLSRASIPAFWWRRALSASTDACSSDDEPRCGPAPAARRLRLDRRGRLRATDRVWLEVVGVVQQPTYRAAGGRTGAGRPKPSNLPPTRHRPGPLRTEREERRAAPHDLDALILRVTTARTSQPSPSRGAITPRLHHDVRDFRVIVPLRLLEQSRQTQALFNLVMALIAGISLLVGIGIMNIMLAGVVERTREIGVRRALKRDREGRRTTLPGRVHDHQPAGRHRGHRGGRRPGSSPR